MSSSTFDVVIVGGGILGMATAMNLMRRVRASVLVLEAESYLAAHQTGHNSGVIHSGIYYKPGSLKARNCVEGRDALYRFCDEHGVKHERCGKIVVATRPDEVPWLDELERRGTANGVTGIHRLRSEELPEYEPHVAGIAGLWVPITGIVNYTEVTSAYARLFQQDGGTIWTDARVMGIETKAGEIAVESARGTVHCRHLINCGGLQSDRIARMCGVHPKLQIIPFRGEYYELIPERHSLVRNLIYPVPDPRFPFLGVHFTRMIGGGVEAGPNAVLALKREGYRWSNVSMRDVAGMATYGGFWRLILKYWRTGVGEAYRSLSKKAFVRALQRLVPELRENDLIPAGAGVRAQAVDTSGALIDDFRIVESERMIHVLNAPSPGATASLSIGRRIAEMATARFGLAQEVGPVALHP